MAISFRELKTTIFRENKLSRILQNRIFRGIQTFANLPKVSSALLSSLKVTSKSRNVKFIELHGFHKYIYIYRI